MGQGPIRFIFPLFTLGMWALFGVWLANGTWSTTNWITLAISAVVCLLVFRNFVWVFSFSYALAVTLNNLVVLGREGISTGALLVGGVAVLYGLRLFWFVWSRYRSEQYRDRRALQKQMHAQMPPPVRGILYVTVTTLMTFHVITPYLVARTEALNGVVVVGAAVMSLGLIIEGWADLQKQTAKRRDPARWVSTGLYSRVRHPNYAGEIVFQLGLIVAVFGVPDAAWYEYAAGIAAPLYIVILMLTQAGNGDRMQAARYGEEADYAQYRSRSGSLLPIGGR